MKRTPRFRPQDDERCTQLGRCEMPYGLLATDATVAAGTLGAKHSRTPGFYCFAEACFTKHVTGGRMVELSEIAASLDRSRVEYPTTSTMTEQQRDHGFTAEVRRNAGHGNPMGICEKLHHG